METFSPPIGLSSPSKINIRRSATVTLELLANNSHSNTMINSVQAKLFLKFENYGRKLNDIMPQSCVTRYFLANVIDMSEMNIFIFYSYKMLSNDLVTQKYR